MSFEEYSMRSVKKLTCILSLLATVAAGQVQTDYLVHKRGMLNQAVYKTGALGRVAYQNQGTTEIGVPSFEWPANSSIVLDGITYTGQHNSFGGGVQIGATPVDTVARTRLYAYCGGGTNALPQQNSFPIPGADQRIENYPVLENGALNPAYNPDEAEEIIVTQWATPVGITIKRTSRMWSFPDYDDFIIYEYEFENTGDLDGVASTPNQALKLVDLIINFSHGLTGGKYGYDRTNGWSQTGIAGKDYQAHFDRQRWLHYGLHRTGNPEKNLTYFTEWATTGKYGGGLLSPQAPGFMVLYYDTTHLAHKYETTVKFANPLTEDPVSWDSHLHMKQPYYNGVETAQLDGPRTRTKVLDINGVRANPSATDSATYGSDWVGRGEFNWRQSLPQAVGRNWSFGPYILNPGEKLRITIAELCGYGAAREWETLAGMSYGRTWLQDIGGSTGNVSTDGRTGEAGSANFAFYGVPNYWVIHPQIDLNPLTLNPTILHGSDYLTKYPLPEYLNSDVITVREVADRVIEAYTGEPLVNHDTVQYWPEKYQDHGVYALPIPIPAPAIVVENTSLGENRITWGPHVESFTSPRLQGTFDHYVLYKSAHPLGHWQQLAVVQKGDPLYFANGEYQFFDKNTRVGDKWYYSVLSVDDEGNTSGRTNLTLQESAIGATLSLEQVYVAPNPFIVKSGYTGVGDVNTQLRFYNLPKTCTIRIYSFSGQLVQTIEHDVNNIQHPYVQVTRNNQLIASGVYFYAVSAPDGSRSHGKFVIIN